LTIDAAATVSLVQDKVRHAVSLVARGPLSPLLANIYLDALDKELDQRGHSYCRYADDCNIYVSSQAAAERTLASIQDWIEKRLRLKVNAAKSGTGRVDHWRSELVILSGDKVCVASA
jgi:RNA-directed DNA polymerase